MALTKFRAASALSAAFATRSSSGTRFLRLIVILYLSISGIAVSRINTRH